MIDDDDDALSKREERGCTPVAEMGAGFSGASVRTPLTSERILMACWRGRAGDSMDAFFREVIVCCFKSCLTMIFPRCTRAGFVRQRRRMEHALSGGRAEPAHAGGRSLPMGCAEKLQQNRI